MRFRISKNAQSFFSNIVNFEGSHAADDKNGQGRRYRRA